MVRGTNSFNEVEALAAAGKRELNAPLINKENEENIRNEVMKMIMYKTKRVSLCCLCCKRLMSFDMPKGSYDYVRSFTFFAKLLVFTTFGIEVAFTLVDYILYSQALSESGDDTDNVITIGVLDYV